MNGGFTPSLIDGGANICVTGDVNLLVDAVTIPPLPILVALHGDIILDDCCTARVRLLADMLLQQECCGNHLLATGHCQFK